MCEWLGRGCRLGSLASILTTMLFVPSVAAAFRQQPELPDLSQVEPPLIDALDARSRGLLEQARSAAAAAIDERDVQRARESVGRLCLLYVRYELNDAAAACLEQMRLTEPLNFRWPYYQLVLADQSSDLDLAEHAAAEALQLRPDDVPTLIRTGELSLTLGRVEIAEARFRRALELDPVSSAARFGLGRSLVQQGQLEDAIELFRDALRGQPEGSILHYHLGMAFRGLGDLTRAQAELEQNQQVPVVMDDPLGEALAGLGVKREELFERAVKAMTNGRPAEAVPMLRSLLELSPDDAELHYTLARALIDLSSMSEAEVHLERALELEPDYGEAHFNLGLLLGRTGRPALAGEHFERAAEIDPENARWRTMRAQVYAERGDFESAIRELEAVIELDPALAEPRRILGAMLSATGRNREAGEQFEKLRDLAPDDPQAHYGLALSHFRSGSYGVAATVLEQAVKRFPQDLAIVHLLARLLASAPEESLRDGPRAVRLAEQLVSRQLTIDHAETLAMALAEVGRFDDAVTWQRRVIDQQRATEGSATPDQEKRLALYQVGRPFRSGHEGG